jgi:hypothetical protein
MDGDVDSEYASGTGAGAAPPLPLPGRYERERASLSLSDASDYQGRAVLRVREIDDIGAPPASASAEDEGRHNVGMSIICDADTAHRALRTPHNHNQNRIRKTSHSAALFAADDAPVRVRADPLAAERLGRTRGPGPARWRAGLGSSLAQRGEHT